MSVGSNLQEMENVVTKGAKPADPMPKMADPGTQLGSVEDLGGPTPENYRPDDNSAKLKEPSLATVSDVVKKGAKSADPMPKMAKEEEEVEGEVVAEEETTEEEVVAEEETTEEEVVAEEETTEEELVEEEGLGIEEDVQALFEGEELSEEFQEKARTIFETVIKAKISEVKEEVQQQYEASLLEEIISIKEELTDRVDAYLEYVADEWVSENQIAIEKGLQTEMSESFLVGMKKLFEDHYVTIPEDKYNVLHGMVEKLDEMEDKLNEQIEKNIALNQRLAESVSDVIFSEVSEGLALSQKDKLASLAENVEFDGEESYREKLVALKESYFPSTTGTQSSDLETVSEETKADYQPVTGLMESYLDTLNRVSKK